MKSVKAMDAAVKTYTDCILADAAMDPMAEKIDEKDKEFCGITLGHFTAPMYPASAEAQVSAPAWLKLDDAEDMNRKIADEEAEEDDRRELWGDGDTDPNA